MTVASPADMPDTSGPVAAPRGRAQALLAVTAVGVIVAALTWRMGDAGPGWVAADLVLVLALLLGLGRGAPGGAAWLLGASSVWLAFAAARHASDWALVTAFPGSVATLAALALVTARRTAPGRLADVAPTAVAALRELPRGFVDAARAPGRALGTGARDQVLRVARGLLLGAPIVALFSVLLAADASFRRAVAALLARSGDGIDLGTWTGAIVGGLLVAYSVLRRIEPPAVASTQEPPMLPPYRAPDDAAPAFAPARLGPRLAPLTWSVVLAQVSAVFAVYVGANARALVAGHGLLQAPGRWTYASYLHEGFTQVTVAALLAVACVVTGHALLRPRGASSEAPARIEGGKTLVALELVLLSLVALTLASCAHRLALYEEMYGYTYLRLGVWLCQLGVAGLLAMTAARCVARAWRGWGSALGWAAVAFTTLGGSLDADGWIASHNADRAAAGRPLDVGYLSTLSEDARSALPALFAVAPHDASVLAASWDSQATGRRAHGWRTLRGAGPR